MEFQVRVAQDANFSCHPLGTPSVSNVVLIRREKKRSRLPYKLNSRTTTSSLPPDLMENVMTHSPGMENFTPSTK
jgi:hypothetical protein